MKWQAEWKAQSAYIIIIGCGRLGARLAEQMSDEGKDVIVMDKDKDAFKKLSSSYGGLTIIGDGTDFDVLSDAGAGRASSVIAVTDNDNANIMAAQLCKSWFHTKNVICRLYDPEKACVYVQLDIQTVCPAVLSAEKINDLMSNREAFCDGQKTDFTGRRIS